MSATQTIEWTLEAAWIDVLADSADVAAIAGEAGVRRAYDLSVADSLPAVTVQCVGAVPQLARANGYYVAQVRVMALTSMDTDTTGSQRATLCGAIRDVFEGDGLESDLQAAVDGLLVPANSVQQPDPTSYDDVPDATKPVRRAWFEFQCRVTMAPALVNPGS